MTLELSRLPIRKIKIITNNGLRFLPSWILVLVFVLGSATSINTVASDDNQRLFSFAVISDIQYSDKDSRGARHYRDAMGRLDECITHLNTLDIAFTIQLGDLIDGHKRNQHKTHNDLERILTVWNKLNMPKYHVVGNHCLKAGKKMLKQKLGLKKFYYDFTTPEAKGWRFLVLDGNDAGRGVLGSEQLEWLREKLHQTEDNNELVILFNHYALLESTAKYRRMKDPQPVLELINQSKAVVAYIAGHDHVGGYDLHNGIHHLTVKAMVDSPKASTYATVTVYRERFTITGYGAEPSRELLLAHPRIKY